MRKFWVVLLVLLFTGSMLAQEDSIYTDIPQSRTEDGAFVLGDPDAPVTVIEFADYLCPHCQDYEAVTAAFIEEHVATGQARFEYRMFPIIDDTVSPLMSALNECAGEQGLFWEGREILFDMASDQAVGTTIVEDFAERLGVDADVLNECVPTATQYETDLLYGNDLAVTGTPAIRVRVGEDPAGAIEIEGQEYSRGGVSNEVLTSFVENETPEELVSLLNQLRDEDLLQDTSLVSGDPCSAPCWNNITPGETAWEEAVSILEDDDQYTDLQIEEAQEGPAKRAIWGQLNGELCCEIITFDGETVVYIRLLIAPGMTMGELIETYGDPTYVLASEQTRDQAVFSLFYPDVPMLAFAFVAGAEEGELTELSEIIGAQMFTPEDMLTILQSNELLLWDGYKSFKEYEAGELVTPEVGS